MLSCIAISGSAPTIRAICPITGSTKARPSSLKTRGISVSIENPQASVDIVSVNGMVMNGKIHCHLSYADTEKSYGGHLEANNKVFTFAVVTLGVLPASLDMKRFDDKTWR